MESESKFLIERKFAVTLLVIIATTAMIYLGKILPGTYENVMIWTSGIFVVGNVTATLVQVIGMRTAAK